MGSLQQLLDKVLYIQQNCGNTADAKAKAKAEKEMDEFTRQRKKIGREIREVRQQILERNELLLNSTNNPVTARLSSSIRQKLKQVKEDIVELERIQKEDEEALQKRKDKGKEVTPEQETEMQNRVQLIELCNDHVEECKRLEGAAFNRGGLTKRNNKSIDPTVTTLPDIDGELGEIIKEKDGQVDAKLGLVEEGVVILKEMANNMNKEIELQGAIISELDREVDKTNATLENLNARMKKALDSVRKSDKFIMDIILLIIIVAIALYLYNQFK